ncbi:MDR family MFS transporter [Streptomyces sp. SID3343]|uniref:MDR family MFS transporter n=1 Tax=Streptomyces sp. SID3343 TaxID=2690260 RepID=UPI00136F2458|nr:MDR family MFS transporter [Streptomyces sp. SID3343]MYW06620.1 DHA2 family efflux MFS transporter permease subunit [Streptomyces sp. SID3343]
MPPISTSRLSQKVVVGAVFVAAMFVNILDITIINVALPAIGKDLGATQASLATVAVGYLVSLAVFIPASGWLGDRFGTKRIFLIALAIFTGASALCGLAQSIDQLVLFRILQGAGGGMLTPVGMAMMFRVFPPEERVRASRILMVPTALAPALGPVLGGLLVDKASWHWVFFINLPVGIAAFVFGLLFLEEHKDPRAGRFDVPGFILSGAGFALLMYALSEGASKGWGSTVIVSTGITGLVLCVAMVFVELRVESPMLDLRLLKDRLFVSTNIVSMINSAAFLGVLYVFPLMQQQAFGKSALETGLLTFPEAFGVVIATQWVSRLYPVVGPRRLMAGGLLGIAACAGLLALVDGNTSAVLIVTLMFFTGASMAHVMIPMQAAAFARTAPADNGRASTIFNVQRQLGSALGVAVLASVLAGIGTVTTKAGGAPTPNLDAYHVACLVAAGLAILGSIAALTIRDSDAASTMRRKTEVVAPPTKIPAESATV